MGQVVPLPEEETMLKVPIAAGLLAAIFIPFSASAQTTPIDPAAWSTPNVMVEGMRNQSRNRSRSVPSGEASAIRTCQSLPTFRRKLGASDPKIIKLTSLCRQAGYR